jgi:GT2 family glycosyltransferase/glycosyltransferase involved in cell wall biosynthesis
MTKTALDVVVPIYKNAELVRACVDSLLQHLDEIGDRRPRLVLINDSPDDPEVELLLSHYAGRTEADIVVLANAHNMGFVRTANRGLGMALHARRDALLVNSDTITFPGTLRNLLAAVDADPQIGFASPRSNNASICSLPHFHSGVLPTPQQAHERWACISASMPDWHFAPTSVGFYLWIRHSVIANHGGLREEFGVGYEEENDLVMRAAKVGQRAIMVNKAFAFHAGSASFSLTELDLDSHRQENYRRMVALHPEFGPLVRRYESSPHFRAERLMQGLLKDDQGRSRIVFDLSGMGLHHNGTNEHTIAVLRAMTRRWRTRFRISGVCEADVFAFHGLDRLPGLVRVDPGAPGVHAVAVRVAQPFDLHHVNLLECLAPVNVFAMLDTIAQDCSQLSIQGRFLELWEHAASHSNGLLFNSVCSERAFLVRYPQASALPRFTRLLSTRLADYRNPAEGGDRNHVLILGNHFPHKHSEATAMRLSALHPTLQFVVLGSRTYQRGNVTGLQSGGLELARVQALYAEASVVVLPSYMEGFGLGFMHALAAARPIVARRIPATEEILATLHDVRGVHLYDDETQLEAAFAEALGAGASSADDSQGATWDEWADGVARLCLDLVDGNEVFTKAAARIKAGDLLRRAAHAHPPEAAVAHGGTAPQPLDAAPLRTLTLEELLSLDGHAFVEGAYNTILLRPPEQGGMDHHARLLENGVSKVDILRGIAGSPEGLARKAKVDGLRELLARTSDEAAAH